jgi:FkbM family methyltransferase
MTFYSQSNEDKVLYEKYFKKYSLEGKKYYLEMGAIDGVMYSNTKFYQDTLGWTGILIEPNPYMFTKLIDNRPNNKLLNVLCSDIKDSLVFNICSSIPAVSSVELTKPENFDKIYYNYSKMQKINTIPISLDTIVENSGLERIDLCVLDVEGHEINVLNSFSFKFPIVLFLIEFLDDEEKNKNIIILLEKNNFKYIEKCAHNAVFINKNYLTYFEL